MNPVTPQGAHKVTVDEFHKFVHNKKDLYEAVERNGWYLPSRKSNVCTEDYLKNVLMGKTWCPKYEEVRIRPCPRRPPKKILYDKFEHLLTTKKLEGGFDPERQPDSNWLVAVIATLSPDDEIFGKGYVPPPKESKLSEIKAIELPESFLQGLPESKTKSKRKALKIAGEGMAAQRVAMMK